MTAHREERSSSSRGLRGLFTITFVVASIGTLWAGPHILWGAVWATLWMSVYMLIAALRYRPLLTTDSFADSFYYLGFLLTLVALINTLRTLGATSGDAGLEGVLGNFGIALATTVLGLFGRIVLATFRVDEAEMEASIRTQAEEAHEAALLALQGVADQATTFSEDFARQLTESLSPVEAAMGKLAADVKLAGAEFVPLRKHVADLDDTLATSNTRLQEQLKRRDDRLTEETDAILSHLREQTTEFLSGLADMKTASSLIRERAGQAGEDVTDAGQEYRRKLKQAAESLEGPVQALQALVARVDGIHQSSRQSLEAVASQADDLRKTLDALRSSASGLSAAMTEEERALRERVEAWNEGAETLDRVHSRLERVAERSGSATERARSSADDLQETILRCQAGLMNLAETIEQEGGMVRSGLEDWKQTVAQLSGLHSQLLEAVETSEETSRVIRGEIAEGVKALTRSLRRARTNRVEA